MVSGSANEITDIAQQLAWLTAVFRVPKDGELCLSHVKLEPLNCHEFKLSCLELQPVSDEESSCWHEIFPSCVIAHGFPVPSRDQEVGLELPFELMTVLSRVLYPLEYHDGIILKGRSTALIPTAQGSSSVQWHLISSDDTDKQLSTESIPQLVSEWFETRDLDLLRKARTFLGYCRNAEIHLGTATSKFKNILRSGSKAEKSRLNIATKLSILIGSSGNFAFNLGTDLTLPRSLRATTTPLNLHLRDRLRRAKTQPLVLYDMETKRGWLVPELSVVLHISHAQIAEQPHLNCEELDRLGYAEISGDGGQAAFDAITRACEVKLCDKDVDGKPLLFRDIVDKILLALESRKELRIARKDTSGSRQLIRSGLCGWDLIDFVNFDYLHRSREVSIDKKTGGSWDRIASENPDIIVLFCKDLGEIIKPNEDEKVCGSLTPLPEGRSHLIASVPCLEKLASVHGGSSTSTKLTPHLYWHRPPNGKLFEECDSSLNGACNRFQDLGKKDRSGPGQLQPYGAVIFGKNCGMYQNSCKQPKSQPIAHKSATEPALTVPIDAFSLFQQNHSKTVSLEMCGLEADEAERSSRKEGKRPLYPTERTRNILDAGPMFDVQGNQPGHQAVAAGGSSRMS